MAQLVGRYEPLEGFGKDLEEEKEILEQLQDEQPRKPENGLEGFLLKFRVADGYAWYRVVGTDPLQIEHVPYLDAYAIPTAHVRGLRKEDVLDQMETRRKRKELRENK